jgi:hypothetical protein
LLSDGSDLHGPGRFRLWGFARTVEDDASRDAAVIRWLRLLALATAIVAMIGVGVVVGLFLVANSGWVKVDVPPWLMRLALFEHRQHQLWLPALIGGWLATALLLSLLVVWSMWYVWRRRQYETLIGHLEQELASLRNLPLNEPAPLEDLPELPSAAAARVGSVLAAVDTADAEGERDDLGWARD